jgi:hypothetical protein
VLQYQNTPCTTHEAKAEVLHSYYSKQFGQAEQRDCTLAWQNMQLPRHDLTSLDADINVEEVHTTIKQMPAEKASARWIDTLGLFTRSIGISSKTT